MTSTWCSLLKGQFSFQSPQDSSSGRTAGRRHCRTATSSCQHLHSNLHPAGAPQTPAGTRRYKTHHDVFYQSLLRWAWHKTSLMMPLHSVLKLHTAYSSHTYIWEYSIKNCTVLPSYRSPSWSTGLPLWGNRPRHVGPGDGSSPLVSAGSWWHQSRENQSDPQPTWPVPPGSGPMGSGDMLQI